MEKAPAFEWLDRSGKVHSLLYEAEPYKGKTTKVFAYYASPATLGAENSAGSVTPAWSSSTGEAVTRSSSGRNCTPGAATPPSRWTWTGRPAKATR